MALRSMTLHRYEEIRRRLAEGRSLHEIARALGCSRRTVREVRDGERLSPDAPKSLPDPLWMTQLDWPTIIHDLGLGHPLKFLWEEKAKHLTTYSNDWPQSQAQSAALSPTRRNRLIIALRGLDERLADTTHRKIARGLFSDDAIADRYWISHDLRDRVPRPPRLHHDAL